MDLSTIYLSSRAAAAAADDAAFNGSMRLAQQADQETLAKNIAASQVKANISSPTPPQPQATFPSVADKGSTLPDSQGNTYPKPFNSFAGMKNHLQGNDLPNASGGFTPTNEYKKPTEGLLQKVTRYSDYTGEIISNLPKNITYGTAKALVTGMEKASPISSEDYNKFYQSIGLGDEVNSFNKFFEDMGKGSNSTDKAVQDVAGFAVSMFAWTKILGAVSTSSTGLNALFASDLASYYNIDPMAEKLSSSLKEMGVDTSVTNWLAEKPLNDDEGRLKNLLENMGINTIVAAPILAFKGLFWATKTAKAKGAKLHEQNLSNGLKEPSLMTVKDLKSRKDDIKSYLDSKYKWEPLKNREADPLNKELTSIENSLKTSSEQTNNSTSAERAVHFSKAPIDHLDVSKYGTGIKGAEAQRLSQLPKDSPLQKRAYFYLTKDSTLKTKEGGLGNVQNNVDLSNHKMLDIRKPLPEDVKAYRKEFIAKHEDPSTALEKAALKAGYDGYITPPMSLSGHTGVGLVFKNAPIKQGAKIELAPTTSQTSAIDSAIKALPNKMKASNPNFKYNPSTLTKNKESALETLNNGNLWLLTASNPADKAKGAGKTIKLSEAENKARNDVLKKYLRANNIEFKDIKGNYDGWEDSIAVFNISKKDALSIGKAFNQDSIAGRGGLLYSNGDIQAATGKFTEAPNADNYYSVLKLSNGEDFKFSMPIEGSPSSPHNSFHNNSLKEPLKSTTKDFTGMKDDKLLSRTKAVRHQLDKEVFDKGRASGVEHITGVDLSTGQRMSLSIGKKNRVTVGEDIIQKMRSGGMVYITHNHPAGRPLSWNDMAIIAIGKGSVIRAIGHNGNVHALKWKKLFLNSSGVESVERTREVIQDMAPIAHGMVSADYKMLSAKGLQQEDLATINYMALEKAYEAKGMVELDITLNKHYSDMISNNKEYFDSLVEKIVKAMESL